LPRRLDRTCQDSDQLIGLPDKRFEVIADEQRGVLGQPQPVQRFAHFFVRNAELVNEVRAALGTPRFLIVCSATRRRSYELPGNVLRRDIVSIAAKPNDCRPEVAQSCRNVLAFHARHGTRRP
jgi:hypothetical protein